MTRPPSPPRGYSWEPFEAGNDAAMTHGARSERKVKPIAAALAADLVNDAPWLASAAFKRTVESWAYTQAQATILRSYLDEHGLLDGDGEERSAVRSLDRAEGRLAKLNDQLGLNPQALSKILSSAAQVASATGDTNTLAALQAEGAAILNARALTAGAPSPDQPTEGTDDAA